jgi:CRISPR-associated protein Cmr4
MFEKSEMLYLYVETSLHAGSGGSVGVVDLPIQRERVTGYPLVQASGIKGKLRAEAYEWKTFVKRKDAIKATLTKRPDETDEKFKQRSENEARKQAAKALGLELVFGPEGDEAHEHAGALSPGDARLLQFPVRSLVGVFAWTTSRNVLARLKRDLEATGKGTSVTWALNNLPDNGNAWTVDDKSVVANGKVVLEEFTFEAQQHDDVKTIAKWLAENAMPASAEYEYFKNKLYNKDGANVTGSLVILPEDAFRDFTQFATEVVTRIRINQETKTAAGQALWSEEHLPSDTLLYAPLHATRPRGKELPNGWAGTVDEVIDFVKNLGLNRIQLGGDETVGRGIVKLRFSSQAPPLTTQTTGGEKT